MYCNSKALLLGYYKGSPIIEFMLKISQVMDIKPSYFWEYRKSLLDEYLELNPDMLDVFLDLSTTPKRILEEYRQAKYMSYCETK